MGEKEKNNHVKKNNIIMISMSIIIVLLLLIAFIIPNKEGKIKIKIKSTLEKVVEKSDLETVTITYNVIAKQCKKENNCDKSSNNINDFKYVVSCKGTITAGIDFQQVEINIDEKKKKVVVIMPEATITGEPNIGSINFLNGQEVSAEELPNARKLCQETTKEKSKKDGKLIPAAKEQSRVVLEEYYKQWIKAYGSSYVVEVK